MSSSRRGVRNHFVTNFALCAFVLGVVLVATSHDALAQSESATLSGTIVDKTGAVVAGADVTVTNTSTGFTRTVTSGSDGEYNFPDLPLGAYRIRATHSGFKAAVMGMC